MKVVSEEAVGKVEDEGLKCEKFSSQELQQFYDSLSNNLHTKCDFTIDYFDTSLGILYSKETPSSLNFSVAVLLEVLCSIQPTHDLWHKVKYAAFLLNLATRGIEFNLLYDIYHQVELEANFKRLSWREKEVKRAFEEKVVEKLEVKVEGSGLVDGDESKNHSERVPTSAQDLMAWFDDLNNQGLVDTDYHNDFIQPGKKRKRKTKENLKNGKKTTSKKKKHKKNPDILAADNSTTDTTINNFHNDLDDSKEDAFNDLEDEGSDDNYQPNKNEEDQDDDYDSTDEKNGILPLKTDSGGGGGRIRTKIKKEKSKPGRKRRSDFDTIPCTQCDFQAKNNHFFDKHTFEEHEASRLCTQCGYLCATFKDYVAHNQTHLWTCDICKKKVLGLKGFRWHMRRHKVAAQDEDKREEVVKVPCDICGVFLQEKSLKHHKLNDHSEEKIKCDLCDYTANSKYKVSVHRKRHFIKTSNCPECGKVVKDLKSHFRRKCGNSKEKERYYCHLCEKSFSLKHGLDRHIRNIHHRICSYHCDSCEYKTYDNYNLKLHISKNHTKEDMEKICPYCNQKTGSLEHHIKIYHYEDQIKAQQQQLHHQQQSQQQQTVHQPHQLIQAKEENKLFITETFVKPDLSI
eukprot:TRINITY_DN6367_c0_g1_i11.p1 TRINITY_DN6367_c0_g1~~TRINITY_DN6367_c0_g1_i11.p1  ORF type:complete len:628 (-),score=168.56 TRINITY_DN6367_c0_g1_i11:200-2083(-)